MSCRFLTTPSAVRRGGGVTELYGRNNGTLPNRPPHARFRAPFFFRPATLRVARTNPSHPLAAARPLAPSTGDTRSRKARAIGAAACGDPAGL